MKKNLSLSKLTVLAILFVVATTNSVINNKSPFAQDPPVIYVPTPK